MLEAHVVLGRRLADDGGAQTHPFGFVQHGSHIGGAQLQDHAEFFVEECGHGIAAQRIQLHGDATAARERHLDHRGE